MDLSTCSFGTLDNLGNIPTVEPVWRPVATGPRPPPRKCLFCHKGGFLDPAWRPVHQWWRSQRFGVDLSTCSFGTLDNIENFPTVESVWRTIATGPRPPPTRSLLCHRGGCVDLAWSSVNQWWRSQRFGARPVYILLWHTL